MHSASLRSVLRLFRPASLAAFVLLGVVGCDRQPVAPGADGGAFGPGFSTSIAMAAYPQAVISQVYGGGGNSGAPYNRDFVELFNPGDVAVDVGGWRIHYASASGNTWNNTYTLPIGATIQPGGYYLVQMAGGSAGVALPQPDAEGSINLAAASGKVVLTSSAVTLSGECPADGSIVDRVSFGSTNCITAWGSTETLSNTTAALRNEGGCSITGSSSDDFTRGPPAPRNSASETTTCAPRGGAPVTVTVSPEAVSVSVGWSLTFAASAEDDQGRFSFTTYSWSSSNPAVASIDPTTGEATAHAEGTVTITATAANGVTGTAALTVTAPRDVVISQLYGGGGNSGAPYNRDYVELFNRGRDPVNVSGWSIQYASATGTGSWAVNTLGSAVIPAGGYFLVQLAGGTAGDPLPAPDATGSSNMAAGSGKVILSRSGTALSGACPVDGSIVDRVSYGSTNCSTDWGTTPVLNNTLAALRLDGGCAMSGNVGADFASGAPAPRNSASGRNLCPHPPVSVTVSPDPASVAAGGTQLFRASAVGPDGMPTTTAYTWSSSNAALASVDASTGVATGLEQGTVVITATAANGVSGTATFHVTAPPPRTGIVITEFLADPDGADALGEWFEVYNAGPGDLNLKGWRIQSGSSTGVEVHTIASDLVVKERGFAVLGNNADAGTNGGVAVRYSYGSDIILNNSNTDWVTIKRPNGVLEDSISYSARSADGAVVDPRYTPAMNTSRVLIDLDRNNTIVASANWRNSTTPFGDGRNLGSPGWGAYRPAGAVESVVISPENTFVVLGGTQSFSSLALDALGNVSTSPLVWTSSNNSIATVTSAGVVTGHAEGAVQIHATASNGKRGTASLTVVHPSAPATVVASVSDPQWVPVGYHKRVFATVRDHEGNILSPNVTWTVSDPSLARIDEFDGRFYMATLAPGTVTLRATASNGAWGSRSFTIMPGEAPTPAVYRDALEFGKPRKRGLDDGITVARPSFVSSFSVARGGPNWVSWNINATQFGSIPRCNCFSPDLRLPVTAQTVVDSDYIGGGYDRGHMVQSESRTTTYQENAATYLFTNILPQAPDNNQGSWYNFEEYNNQLARGGKELYVFAGGDYSANPQTVNGAGKIQIPEYTWKITVVMDGGKGIKDVRTPDDLQVIAVRMPNLNATAQRNAPWQNFRTTVREIEKATGYDLLIALPDSVQPIVKTGTRAPVAVLPASYSTIVGLPLTFDGSASSDPDGDAITFSWNFGDGKSGVGPKPTHTYASAGSFSVYMRVTDAHGAYGSARATVTVVTPQTATRSLQGSVNELVASTSLTSGNGTALNGTLSAAIQQMDEGNRTAAAEQLGAFNQQVTSMVRSDRISNTEAAQLIAQSDRIRTAISTR